MGSVQGHVEDVISRVQHDATALTSVLSGLRAGQEGQQRLGSKRPRGALPFLREEVAHFEGVPDARRMLGITHTDVAAACADDEDFAAATTSAREAIRLVGGDETFAETEANAHMTVANALARTGLGEQADGHYEKARGIYSHLPGGNAYLRALEDNQRVSGRSTGSEPRPWWKVW